MAERRSQLTSIPIFGDVPVQAVDVGLVMKALEPIWTDEAGNGEPGARPDRNHPRLGDGTRLSARARTRRAGAVISKTCCRRKRRCAAVEHHAALPYAEIAGFMAELRQQEGVAACALEFAILTAARTGEVIGARWDEINLADRLMDRTGRADEGRQRSIAYRCPTRRWRSSTAMAAIRQGDFVFPGGRTGRPLSTCRC